MMTDTDSVYVVYWPAASVIKVGESGRGRHRAFMRRGAELLALCRCSSTGEAIRLESKVRAALAPHVGGLPWTHKPDAIPFLGGSGGGYMECRTVDPGALDAIRALLPSIATPAYAQASSRAMPTDGRTYGDALPTSSCISPVVTRAISSIDEGCE